MKTSKIICIFAAFIFMGCSVKDQMSNTPFDKEIWRKADESERHIYVVDLLNKKLLTGLTKEEVIKLLGSPSYVGKNEISYVIKTDGAGFDKIFTLDVFFDKNTGVVTKYFVRGD